MILQQSAALVIHRGRVCLVTATSGRRWILPKGTLEIGQSLGDCAVTEAWEEAGIHGRVYGEPIARYAARKDGRSCNVSVFRLVVDRVAADWPERGIRQRRWLTLAQAMAVIDVPEIRDVLRELQKSKKNNAHPARSTQSTAASAS
jgi:8-oxo-dGTP pyrophosphatase MutT (NUDIX family)